MARVCLSPLIARGDFVARIRRLTVFTKIKEEIMSWDVLLINVPDKMKSPNDLPDDFKSTLGITADVHSTLSNIVPEIDLHDPAWGNLKGDGFSIEFNIGKNNPVESIMLHVRDSNGAITIIEHICKKTGWRALDTSTGNFIDFNQNPERGFEQWRSYRNQVAKSLQNKS